MSTQDTIPTRRNLRGDTDGADPALLDSIHVEAADGARIHEHERVDGVVGDLVEGAESVNGDGEEEVTIVENGGVA